MYYNHNIPSNKTSILKTCPLLNLQERNKINSCGALAPWLTIFLTKQFYIKMNPGRIMIEKVLMTVLIAMSICSCSFQDKNKNLCLPQQICIGDTYSETLKRFNPKPDDLGKNRSGVYKVITLTNFEFINVKGRAVFEFKGKKMSRFSFFPSNVDLFEQNLKSFFSDDLSCGVLYKTNSIIYYKNVYFADYGGCREIGYSWEKRTKRKEKRIQADLDSNFECNKLCNSRGGGG